MKKIFLLSILIISIIFGIIIYKKESDWSKINSLIYDSCNINGILKKSCTINLAKLDTEWDKLYFFEGGRKEFIDTFFKQKLPIHLDPFCQYLILSKKNQINQVYKQCFNMQFRLPNNIYDSIYLNIDFQNTCYQFDKNEAVIDLNLLNNDSNNNVLIYGFKPSKDHACLIKEK